MTCLLSNEAKRPCLLPLFILRFHHVPNAGCNSVSCINVFMCTVRNTVPLIRIKRLASEILCTHIETVLANLVEYPTSCIH